jgi:hypothetical protein
MQLLPILRPLFVAPANTELSPLPSPKEEETTFGWTHPSPEPASPVFLTTQSLVSFPGASLAINILWNAVNVFNSSLAQLTIVPMSLAFIVGIAIYLISVDEKMTRRQKFMGAFIAAINSAWLGLNALGIDIINPPSIH